MQTHHVTLCMLLFDLLYSVWKNQSQQKNLQNRRFIIISRIRNRKRIIFYGYQPSEIVNHPKYSMWLLQGKKTTKIIFFLIATPNNGKLSSFKKKKIIYLATININKTLEIIFFTLCTPLNHTKQNLSKKYNVFLKQSIILLLKSKINSNNPKAELSFWQHNY